MANKDKEEDTDGDEYPNHQIRIGQIEVSTRKDTLENCKKTVKELFDNKNIRHYLDKEFKLKLIPDYVY